MRVLVVDDTSFMRSTIRRILEKNNITDIFEAVNGKEAVTKYKVSKPDLVIMDISMPVMNGIEAVEEIKKGDEHAKVIICSLQGQKDNVMQAIKAGAKSFIVKPVKEEKLMKEIAKINSGTRSREDESEQSEALRQMKQSMEELKASVDYMRGLEEGYLESKREIATNMLRLGLDKEIISKCVDLTEEEITCYGEDYKI